MSEKAARQARRRAEILQHAAHLIGHEGYDRTSLKAIAASLGLTEPALYYYFKSKEHLLFALADEVLSTATEAVREIARSDLGSYEKMDRIIRYMVRSTIDSRTMFQAYFGVKASLRNEFAEAVGRRENEFFDVARQVFRDGVEQGVFKERSGDVPVLAALGAAAWTYTWFNPEGPLSVDEVADGIASTALDGLTG